MSAKDYPVVISFFTPEWEYPEHARRLQEECKSLSLDYSIEPRDSTNDYKRNTRIKPFFIREMITDLDRPVLWVDVDSSVLAVPTELVLPNQYDMAAVRMRPDNKLQRQWQVGVLFFQPNDRTMKFIDQWCNAATSGTDEGAFEYAFRNAADPLSVLELDRDRWYQVLKDGHAVPSGIVCGVRIAKSELKYASKSKDKAKAQIKTNTHQLIRWKMRGEIDTEFGSMIGAGDTRLVYHDAQDTTKVIKHLYHGKNSHNANITEWEVWQKIKELPCARYFAACHDISECGRYLQMTKAMRNSRRFQAMADSIGQVDDRLNVDNLVDLPGPLKHDIDRMHQWGVLGQSMVIIDYGSVDYLAGLQDL